MGALPTVERRRRRRRRLAPDRLERAQLARRSSAPRRASGSRPRSPNSGTGPTPPPAACARRRARPSASGSTRSPPTASRGPSSTASCTPSPSRPTRKNLRVTLFTAADPEAEIRQFRRLSDGADVDAFVLTSTFHGDPRTEWLIEHGQSFVTFGRPWGIDDMNDPQHLWVDVDGWDGLRAGDDPPARRPAPGASATSAGRARSGTGDDRRRGWLETMRGVERPRRRTSCATLAVATEDGVTRSARMRCGASRRQPAGWMRWPARATRSPSARSWPPPAASRSSATTTRPSPRRSASRASSSRSTRSPPGVLELLTGAHGGRVHSGSDAVADPRHRLVKPQLVVREFRPLGAGAPGA